jgi:hypothetical protein
MIRIYRSCRVQLFWLCAAFFFSPGFLPGDEESGNVFSDLWGRVEDQKLWDDPEWWTLGHYHRTMWGQVASRVDDDRFFLHPKGKTHRKLELKATLDAFVNPVLNPDPDARSLACRFPARRKWLIEKLSIPEEVFAVGECDDYVAAIKELNVERAVVIYPSAYLNSPASMFGHLLLVLDRKGKDRLLSRAVNYAAIVEDSFGPLFAVKGIFGLYEGIYTILPYYDKVEEYSAVNRRDIWEYPLELTAEELDRLLRHVWELQELKSRYFFFKENCAFNLLYPIEVARPSLSITRRFRLSAVPVSLLQQLTDSQITGEPVFRPSKSFRMKAIADALSPSEQKQALALAQGKALSGEETPLVLSLAVELTQYRYTEREISPEVYKERVFPLLRARSRHGKVDLPDVIPPLPPSAGHAPQRVDTYVGFQKSAGMFGGLRWRAAYHDELDDPRGYPPGSSITFFGLDLRTAPGKGISPEVKRFSLIDIRSLSPPELWVRPLSWAASVRTESDPTDVTHHRTITSFATGYTWRLPDGNPFYLMMSHDLRLESELDEVVGWEPGVQWGLKVGGERLRMGVSGFHQFGVWGSDGKRQQVSLEIRSSLDVNTSVSLRTDYIAEDQDEFTEVMFGVLRTF